MSGESLEDFDAAQHGGATAELAALAKSLSEDPKTRKRFLQLIKEKNPDQAIPELDLENQIAAFAKPHIEELSKIKLDLLKRDQEASILAKREALKAKGFTIDDVSAIEKLMIEKQIGSHDTAAEFYRAQAALAAPTPSTFTQVQMPVKGDEIKKAGGIKRWANAEAHKVVDDIKAGRIKLTT